MADVLPQTPDGHREPTVTVVIPCRNDSEALAACLAALSEQTRPADQIIVVDNASSDDSAATARRAHATVIGCSAPGIPAASARGYDAADGELILRLDADCIPPASWVGDVVSAFEEDPDASAVTGRARFHDGPALLRRPLAAAYLFAYDAVSTLALGHRPLFGSNFAMRRSVWEDVGGAVDRDDPNLHDDLDLSFHIGSRYRIGRVRGHPMAISMRPVFDARAMSRRFKRGMHTVTSHWPIDFPPLRWGRLLRRRFSKS